MKLLIKNGRVVNPAAQTDDILDILIENGKFARMGKKIAAAGAKTFNAAGMVVAPGFIDMHVHLREPGFERKETIATGLAAALAGGFTAVACMPNTDPVNDSGAVTRYILDRAKTAGHVAVFPIGAVTKGLEGKELAPYAEMKGAGVRAVSDDGMPVANAGVMRRAMEYAGSLGLVVIDHAEDKNLTGSGVMHEGAMSARLGLPGVPAESETVMIERDIALARLTGMAVHIAHVSTRLGVEAVRRAKDQGLRVTAEATPHHFSLNDEAVREFSTSAKMAPPLRSEEDRKAVVKGLADGTLDVIATDHAPHTYEEKLLEFDRAPNGIIGLQTAVPLAIENLVLKKKVSLARMVDAFTGAPACILGLGNRGRIEVGLPANLTLFSLEQTTFLTPDDIKSLGKNSPFLNRKIKGAVTASVIAGKLNVLGIGTAAK
ncbi:MAG: dihydroorotase [Acidobacteriota bacterium]